MGGRFLTTRCRRFRKRVYRNDQRVSVFLFASVQPRPEIVWLAKGLPNEACSIYSYSFPTLLILHITVILENGNNAHGLRCNGQHQCNARECEQFNPYSQICHGSSEANGPGETVLR